MKKLKVQKLTEEAFRPFGSVITTKGRTYGGQEGVFRWYEKQGAVEGAQDVSVNLLTAVARAFTFGRFEAHARTTETLLPLTGGVIVAGMPAGEAAPGRLQAFYIPVGEGVCWAAGAWHYAPYPLGEDAVCAAIFRHGTGEGDSVFFDLEQPMGLEL
ncbi:MAG TPA: ureidoglycolate lyase [Feifaniaceae bacterium]|nr:ureidoglycolate lyase [Feifaniaceae bacterium]